jgi:4-amino-4-deoxy-L-arabinose transferase-like glycosyltransferase
MEIQLTHVDFQSNPLETRRPVFRLGAIVLLGFSLRVWALGQGRNGDPFAATNLYYSAGVRSMLDSWHNFFFNAFDPAGFVSLDKPPVAFWIQVVSARLFGFSAISVLIPQVLEGVAAILLLNHLVHRRFGVTAGLFAALFLAATPISVAVDRSNDADGCLALTLLLAAWPLILAVERGSMGLLLLAMAILGVAFNVKMLAAFVVVPAFGLTYLLAAPVSWLRRVGHLAAGGIVLFAVSFSWCAAYDLTPPDRRPFVDSSTDNSMFELVFGHNGVQRFVRRGALQAGAGALDQLSPQLNAPQPPASGSNASNDDTAPRSRGLRGAARTPVGPLRLVAPLLACQVAWFLPFAIAGVAITAGGMRRGRAAIVQDKRLVSVLLWAASALVTGIVYSYAGGIFQLYYLDTLAAPLAALAGIGLAGLLSPSSSSRRRWALPVALLAAIIWDVYIGGGYIDWGLGIADGDAVRQTALDAWSYGLGAAAFVAVAGLALAWFTGKDYRSTSAKAGFAVAIAVLVAAPACWGLGSVLGTTSAAFPSAGLPVAGGLGDTGGAFRGQAPEPRGTEKLVAFLEAHRDDARFLAATLDSRQAAPIIVATGSPVMSIGGFSGADPILSPERLAALRAAGQLRYVMIEGDVPQGDGGQARGYGREAGERQKEIVAWVRANGKPVDPAEWRLDRPDEPESAPVPRRGRRQALAELYDLGL